MLFQLRGFAQQGDTFRQENITAARAKSWTRHNG